MHRSTWEGKIECILEMDSGCMEIETGRIKWGVGGTDRENTGDKSGVGGCEGNEKT